MAMSTGFRLFQSRKAKDIFKDALTKRPKSIQSLKKSLFINHSNLDEFVKYIKEPPTAFATNHHKTEEDEELMAEVNGLRNIAKNIEVKHADTKDIFLRRNSMKCKKLKKELKIQRSDLKFNAEPQNEQNILSHSFYRGRNNNGSDSLRQRIPGLELKSNRTVNETQQKRRRVEMRNTFSVNNFKNEGDESVSHSCKFWRKPDKSQTAHRRWKTQTEERTGDKSLGEITKYCQRKNMKGINYLVLQLHMNIQGSKRIRKTTGPSN